MPRSAFLVALVDATLAWRVFDAGFRAPARTRFAYHVDASFCDDSWQQNADVVFYETENASVADVTVGAKALTAQALGVASWRRSEGGGDILVDADACWYAGVCDLAATSERGERVRAKERGRKDGQVSQAL